ncbi:unnamed protein product [Mesocestoides corti]|uniref:Ovule protein n=1 Tax=Mesocestoides corti TaxID=53468 RepID=A0A0R3ULS7_MESCO|nr:unnamed protein product [Mesocestoides corti]
MPSCGEVCKAKHCNSASKYKSPLALNMSGVCASAGGWLMGTKSKRLALLSPENQPLEQSGVSYRKNHLFKVIDSLYFREVGFTLLPSLLLLLVC